jgi:hypothetical protein
MNKHCDDNIYDLSTYVCDCSWDAHKAFIHPILFLEIGCDTVVDDDNDDQEDDAKTLQYLSQFSGELGAQMDGDFGNEQGGDDASGCHRTMTMVVSIVLVEHVRGMQKNLTTWRT